ncbi:hypothetical protein RRG08_043358 [Elysia crispata]|uniref:Uncharacterized protein n=1 Tax=Elysia crispata TaxID=231223 RepID=A0AAE0Z6B9_9GAST|nr:hypothetical protein RRG08_043358 [Elysia crispata]
MCHLAHTHMYGIGSTGLGFNHRPLQTFHVVVRQLPYQTDGTKTSCQCDPVTCCFVAAATVRANLSVRLRCVEKLFKKAWNSAGRQSVKRNEQLATLSKPYN